MGVFRCFRTQKSFGSAGGGLSPLKGEDGSFHSGVFGFPKNFVGKNSPPFKGEVVVFVFIRGSFSFHKNLLKERKEKTSPSFKGEEW